MGINNWTYEQCQKNIENAVELLEQKATETTEANYKMELETAKEKLNGIKQKITEMYKAFPEYIMLTNVEVLNEDCGKGIGFMFNGDYVAIDYEIFHHQETFRVYLKAA